MPQLFWPAIFPSRHLDRLDTQPREPVAAAGAAEEN
jgi:hypothetical protein